MRVGNSKLMPFSQGLISNILEEDVVQPLLVSTSAVELATETVCLLLKIDDYVQGGSSISFPGSGEWGLGAALSGAKY